jgi:hypothetical protein
MAVVGSLNSVPDLGRLVGPMGYISEDMLDCPFRLTRIIDMPGHHEGESQDDVVVRQCTCWQILEASAKISFKSGH